MKKNIVTTILGFGLIAVFAWIPLSLGFTGREFCNASISKKAKEADFVAKIELESSIDIPVVSGSAARSDCDYKIKVKDVLLNVRSQSVPDVINLHSSAQGHCYINTNHYYLFVKGDLPKRAEYNCDKMGVALAINKGSVNQYLSERALEK